MKKHKFLAISYEWVRYKSTCAKRIIISRRYKRICKVKCKNCGLIMIKPLHCTLKYNDWRDDCNLMLIHKVHKS